MNDSTGHHAVLAPAALLALALVAAPAAGQQSTLPPVPGTEQECLELLLRAYDDPSHDPSLTREERIAKLDAALLQALSVGFCQAAVLSGVCAGGADGADGSGGEAAASANSANANPGAPLESLPASGIQGDLPDSEAAETAAVEPARELPGNADAENIDQTEGGGAPGNVPGVDAPAGGSKVPDDIPPAANDDIIAQQLRQAATDEQDPATRAKLWNEYRRYNNLPVKDIPESAGQPDGGGDDDGTADGDAGAN